MLYANKSMYIEAIEWNEPGDHPGVGYFRHPPVDPDTGQISAEETAILMGGMRHCDVPHPFRRAECTRIMRDHGHVDAPEGMHHVWHGEIVCPGDMVLVLSDGRAGYVWHPEIFAKFYDRVDW